MCYLKLVFYLQMQQISIPSTPVQFSDEELEAQKLSMWHCLASFITPAINSVVEFAKRVTGNGKSQVTAKLCLFYKTSVCTCLWKRDTCMTFHHSLSFIFLCPIWKKGTYCFAPVSRSVDQTMSAQYHLTLLLESYQTWYSECPEVIDDPYRFWSHMVKAQGQTAGRCKNYVWSTSLALFARKLPNLVWMPLESRWPLLIFRSHGQRSRSNCWSLYK